MIEHVLPSPDSARDRAVLGRAREARSLPAGPARQLAAGASRTSRSSRCCRSRGRRRVAGPHGLRPPGGARRLPRPVGLPGLCVRRAGDDRRGDAATSRRCARCPPTEFFADSFTYAAETESVRAVERDVGRVAQDVERRPVDAQPRVRAPRARASAPRRDARWLRRAGRVSRASRRAPRARASDCRARGSPRDTSAPCPTAAARSHSRPSAYSSAASWLCATSQRSAVSSCRVASGGAAFGVEQRQARNPNSRRGFARGFPPPRDRRRAAGSSARRRARDLRIAAGRFPARAPSTRASPPHRAQSARSASACALAAQQLALLGIVDLALDELVDERAEFRRGGPPP